MHPPSCLRRRGVCKSVALDSVDAGQEAPALPDEPASLYRPRRPRESPLYRLADACCDEVKGRWEEDFERRYGFWRGSVEDAVYGFLDCGIFDRGFARVSCTECRAEYLVAFSWQRRGFCPSCAAKRGALFGAFLAEEVVEPVGHCLWTFTVPKMLRPYFLYHRDLLGGSVAPAGRWCAS